VDGREIWPLKNLKKMRLEALGSFASVESWDGD